MLHLVKHWFELERRISWIADKKEYEK